MPEDAFRILQNISKEDRFLLGLSPYISPPQNMIIKNLAVAPPSVRPSLEISNSGKKEDDLTLLYQKILQTNNSLMG
jgi:DNA-directed RNA polymerase beta' subunit